MSLALYGRNLAAYVPGLTTYLRRRFDPGRRSRVPRVPPMYSIPLGYNNQLDLPIKPISERRTGAFFAGSVEHERLPRFSYRRALRSPKTISRRQMVEGGRRAQVNRPDLNIELTLLADFQAGMAADRAIYSHALMDSKVCLVPRGAAFDTFRFYEAIRYGCVVVSDGLPPSLVTTTGRRSSRSTTGSSSRACSRTCSATRRGSSAVTPPRWTGGSGAAQSARSGPSWHARSTRRI
jgi:hypothetical protein